MSGETRSGALAGMAMLLVAFAAPLASALDISNRYRSPRNPERRVRPSTRFIVLHTTEAPARSSLNKLSDRGEAHYCVTEVGQIYRIVDRDRMAFHAGRSMWQGQEDVDNFSVGIECVGYHDKPMPSVQLAAIRELVAALQKMYGIPDERVVCHSHVAYGAPNKWQKRRHRGRKRCGMLFAMPSVRKALGLRLRPAFDPDTRANHLAVGDDYLHRVLYGNIDTMRGKIGSDGATASPRGWFARLVGGEDKPAARPAALKPAAPKPAAPKPANATAKPAPRPTSGAGSPTSIAALKAQGYVLKGTISRSVSAIKLAGGKWNAPSTYYVIRQKVVPGNKVDASRLEKGTGVWMKK